MMSSPLLASFVFGFAAFAGVIPAPLHATVTGTNPAAGATLTEAPETFSITASENILSVSDISTSNVIAITDAGGGFYGTGCVSVEGDTMRMEADLGQPGEYTMAYQLVSADGHAIDGEVMFSWDPSDTATTVQPLAQRPECGAETATATEAPATSESAGDASEIPAASTGAEVDASEGEDGAAGGFPYVAVGAIGLLVVGGVIAYTWRRGMQRNRASREERDQPPLP